MSLYSMDDNLADEARRWRHGGSNQIAIKFLPIIQKQLFTLSIKDNSIIRCAKNCV